jgi:Zn-dependent M16 (insulinase) family peptidase
MGKILIGSLGPPANDFLTRHALGMLGMYLTSSKVAPLNKEYVEIEAPLWYTFTNFFLP